MKLPEQLLLIAEDPSPRAKSDAEIIRAAILADGRAHHGLIDSNRVRQALRHSDELRNLRVIHKHIGAQYSAMRQRGLIVKRGYIESTDVEGHNAGRPMIRWALTELGVAGVMAVYVIGLPTESPMRPDVWYRSESPYSDFHLGSCDVWYGDNPCTCDPVAAERVFLQQAEKGRR